MAWVMLALFVAQTAGPVGRGVVAGREAGDGLEDAVQVMAAQAGPRGQFGQAGRRLGAFDEAAQFGDAGGVLFGEGRLVWPAAPARAKAGGKGVGGAGVKGHVFRARVAGAAGRAAEHAGAAHRVDEVPVGGRGAGEDLRPARVGGGFSGAGLEAGVHGRASCGDMPVI